MSLFIKCNYLRAFSTVAIISDMLYISAISTDRMARYKLFMNKVDFSATFLKMVVQCLSNGPAPATIPAPASTPQMVHPSDELKNAMVAQFCMYVFL